METCECPNIWCPIHGPGRKTWMETRLINTSTNAPTIERTDVKVNSAACGSCQHLWDCHDGECKAYMTDGSICGCRKIVANDSDTIASPARPKVQTWTDPGGLCYRRSYDPSAVEPYMDALESELASLRETISGERMKSDLYEKTMSAMDSKITAAEATISTLQEDLALLAEKVVIERAESNALRAENQELRQLVKEYRTNHAVDDRCQYCIKADALLEPVAPDQPAKEAK